MTARGRFLTRNRAIALVAVALLGLGGVALANYIGSGPTTQPAVQQPLPPVEEQPLTDTNLTQAKQALGPFETIAVSADTPTPDTHSPAVLLLNQDNSTQASQRWTIPFNGSTSSWKQTSVTQIRSISLVNGYVTFGSNLNRTFVVKCNQPFIFEEMPQQVVVIDPQGNTWSTTTARATASRQPLK
jgi:hypothetical protein